MCMAHFSYKCSPNPRMVSYKMSVRFGHPKRVTGQSCRSPHAFGGFVLLNVLAYIGFEMRGMSHFFAFWACFLLWLSSKGPTFNSSLPPLTPHLPPPRRGSVGWRKDVAVVGVHLLALLIQCLPIFRLPLVVHPRGLLERHVVLLYHHKIRTCVGNL